MPWWAWLIFGGVLAALELLGDTAFYLIFFALAALGVGLLGVAGAGLPLWAQWVLFAAAAIVSMVLFRKKLYERMRGGLPGFDGGAQGAVVDVTEDVATGGRVRVQMRGSEWTATNIGDAPIAAGSQARVVGTKGAGLEIEALGKAPAV